MKQLLIPLLGAAAFIIIVGLMYNNKIPIKTGSVIDGSQAQNQLKIRNITIDLEIADSKEERANGLSGRSSLDEGRGMFFVFDSKDTKPGFWMKGMQMPIDIIWINDSKISKIDSKVPFPKEGESKFQTYFPDSEIDYVLEVTSGYSEKVGITVGDIVTLPEGY